MSGDDKRQRVKPEPAGPVGTPSGRDPLAHLDTVRRSIRSMAEPLQKLNTREFPPLTYVEDTAVEDIPVPPKLTSTGRLQAPETVVAALAGSLPAKSDAFGALKARLESFEERLQDSQEIGVRLAPMGPTEVLRLARVSYVDPELVVFEGHIGDSPDPCEYLTHLSQLQLLLLPVAASQGRAPLRLTWS